MIDIGKTLADGSIYAGHHPVHEGFLVCKAEDEPDLMTWGDANRLLDGFFALPTRPELSLLYSYRHKICGFDEAWYWSSSGLHSSDAWVQGFTDGDLYYSDKGHTNRVRLVRTVRHSELKHLIREIWW